MNARTLRRSPGPRKRVMHVPLPGVKRWHVNLGVLCGAVGALVILAGFWWLVYTILVTWGGLK